MRYLLIALIFLFSCTRTPQQAQKRISKLLKKFPEAAVIQIDTVTKETTIVVPKNEITNTEIDSILNGYCDTLKLTDTIAIYKFKEKIRDRFIERASKTYKDTTVKQEGMLITVRHTAKGMEIFGKCECIQETKVTSYTPTWYQMFKVYPTQQAFFGLGWLLIAFWLILMIAKR